MLGVMMKLGDYKFSVSTAAYQSFTRSTQYRWQAQERYGQLPAQQYTGPGEDSISLSGDIYPSFFSAGVKQIDAMRAEAIKGTPLLLVDGNGFVWGRWVIQSIEDQQAVFFSDGTPRKMGFNMKLAQYGEDSVSGSSDTNWLNELKSSVTIVQPTDNSWVNDIHVVRIK